MEEPAELEPPSDPPRLVIGYAEPSTRPRRSFLRWIGDNWLFLCVKSFLLLALSFIGGTVGAQYVDLTPAKPWHGRVDVIDPQRVSSSVDSPDLKAVHDLLGVENNQNLFHSYAPFSAALSDDERKNDVQVSSIRSDGSFTINLNTRTEDECDADVWEYEDALSRAINLSGRHLAVRSSYSRKTTTAECAPAMAAGVGVVAGLLIGFIAIRISSVGFHRASQRKAA